MIDSVEQSEQLLNEVSRSLVKLVALSVQRLL
jgi:hypothetical protein